VLPKNGSAGGSALLPLEGRPKLFVENIDPAVAAYYYAARRNGGQMVGLAPHLRADDELLREGRRKVAPLLRTPEAEIERLAARAQLQQYDRGEILLRQGEASTRLHVILRGRAQAIVDDLVRGRLNMLELAPDDYYGETVLTGEPSAVTIIALTELTELVLEGEELPTLIDEVPRLAQDLGETMEQRRRILRSLQRTQRLRLASNGRRK